MTHSEPLGRFVEVFSRLAGHAHRAETAAEVRPLVEAVLEEQRPELLAVTELPADLREIVRQTCSDRRLALVESPFTGLPLPDTVDRARVGITMATFAVAETGSIVEVTRQDADRLVSSLPRVHICFVRRDTIVPTLADAGPLLREVFAADGAQTATFISGPSRTGDIEMKLTLGVHGPEIMHVIVLD